MRRFPAVFSILGLLALLPGGHARAADPYTVLHAFNGPDGQYPEGGVTVARDGTIYGSTGSGGAFTYYGTIFKSDPAGHVVTLHSFDQTDGAGPDEEGSPTLLGQKLYGEAEQGGAVSIYFGVLYSINTDGSDYTVLHSFNGYEGYFPIGNLQHITGRGFVGVAYYGGMGYQSAYPGDLHGHGVLFALTRGGSYRLLHEFAGGSDGTHPDFVVTDAAGDIYGSASGGGTCPISNNGCGVIFKYDPATEHYSVIYTFTGGADGAYPTLGSIGADGTLYGVTAGGSGASRYGTLFALKPSATGYAIDTLADSAHFLFEPQSGPTLTAGGLLIGTTQEALYAYNLNSHKHDVLQWLTSLATGTDAYAQPAVAGDGSILGTTRNGGEPLCSADLEEGCGTLFRYTYAPAVSASVSGK